MPRRRSVGPSRCCSNRAATYRVVIANGRLLDFSDGSVAFRWKDYRRESKLKVMRLTAAEFTRRFLLHVLPSGLQRIR
jgi:hypothetical protein